MTWYQSVVELIDLRSFSNLWFWIALAVMWSGASHWILGVPFDLVQRAARHGGQAEQDLEDLVRINLNRIFYVLEYAGVWVVGIAVTLLTTLGSLGFFYSVEFAQAVFLLAFPMSLIGLLNIWTGHRIRRDAARGDVLRNYISRHRFVTQGIGVISIFVTAMWGMYKNLLVGGPLGG